MDYVSRIVLDIDGQQIEDFNAFTQMEEEIRKKVKLMNGTGHILVNSDPAFSLDYVTPKDGPEFDFRSLEECTVTADYENGKKVVYTGCKVLKIGQRKFDGDKEATREITFGAKSVREDY